MLVDSYFDDRDNDGGVEWWQTTGQKREQERDQMAFMFRDTSNKQQDYTPLPAGSHAARCYAVVDLGTQKLEFQGEVKLGRRVRISWEVPGERMADGRPFSISKTYKTSLHKESNLRKDLRGWRGKDFTEAELNGFDPRNLLGKTAILGVTHAERNGRLYANIDSVGVLPKGMEVGKPENEPIFFDVENFDDEVFAKLGKYAQEQVMASPEYANRAHKPAVALDDEEIPF